MADSEYYSPYRPDGKLYGFVCVVTGALQPVGSAIVAELAAHNAACIFACAPTGTPNSAFSELLEKVASTTAPSGGSSGDSVSPNGNQGPSPASSSSPSSSSGPSRTKVLPYPFDVSSEAATLQLIDDVLNTCGRLDVWVCSAGLLGPASIEDTHPEALQRCWEANALAPFFALKYARRAMEKTCARGSYPNAAPKDGAWGSIVVVASVAGTYGGCWGPAYTMSSHAALGVVRSGVAVLKGSNVRINAISPGQIDLGLDLAKLGDMRGLAATQLPPVKLQSPEQQKANIGLERAGRPAEVARVAGFLASGFSAYMTGANLIVDGGASAMAPLIVPI